VEGLLFRFFSWTKTVCIIVREGLGEEAGKNYQREEKLESQPGTKNIIYCSGI
jgi:hypothetical protein